MYDWHDILDFWFGQLDCDGLPDQSHRKRWFSGGKPFDREIRRRFLSLLVLISEGGLDHWLDHSEGYLAQILVLDQFSRNIFRGTAMAFESDRLALGLCLRGLERGRDVPLPPVYRAFFYMPLQHSEKLADQHEGVALYQQLLAQVSGREKAVIEGFLDSARAHADIIARFGRFPHRNRVLGRPSTSAEQDYLAGDGKRFGQ